MPNPPGFAKLTTQNMIGQRFLKSTLLDLHYTPAAILHRPPLMRHNPFHPILWASFRMLYDQLDTNSMRLIVLAVPKATGATNSCVRKKLSKKCRAAFWQALYLEGYDRNGWLKGYQQQQQQQQQQQPQTGRYTMSQGRGRQAQKPSYLGGTFAIRPHQGLIDATTERIARDVQKGLQAVLKQRGTTMDQRAQRACVAQLEYLERGYKISRKNMMSRLETMSEEDMQAMMAGVI